MLPALLFAGLACAQDELTQQFLPELPTSTVVTTSTVPANGDLNPNGVAFVPSLFPFGGILFGGPVLESDLLVSNFNSSANRQGAGSSIVRITPYGLQESFYNGDPGLGLTPALGALQEGMILAGSLPSTDGTCANIQGPGAILELNRWGQLVGMLNDPSLMLNGPWYLTVYEENGFKSHVFVSNVLSGTVTRLDVTVSLFGDVLTVDKATQVASGYAFRCDPKALAVGPTGLVFDPNTHTLYVASTGDNAIYSIPNADTATTDGTKGTVVYQDNAHLRGPLGLVLAPNGNLIAANGDAMNADPNHPSELIEFTTAGVFVAAASIDPGSRGAFGLAISGVPGDESFAAVDDVTNTLKVWHVQ
jgi:DNA-binding beta-propeller fold protein YncE